jgi:hypothetical protein
MQDINNRMIAYERKIISPSSSIGDSSSSLAPFRNTDQIIVQPKAIMPLSWCNFCEENHDENTCELKRNVRDKIFGKRLHTTIIF